MKKKLLATIILFFCFCICHAQTEMDKLAADFEKLMKDPKSLYGKNKLAGKYYDIRGFKMYAEVYGKGRPLLIIHGNGGSISNFIKNIPYFSTKYKVIVADSRSQGKSTDKGDSLTYEMMADDYAALLDVMKIDSAYVIGWSDGGINAVLLAIRHPEKVKKLAITGTNLRPDTTAIPEEILSMVRPSYEALKSMPVRNDMEQTGYKLMRLLIEQPNIPDSDLKKVQCPTLVIGGDHDAIKPEHTMEIYNNIPRAYLWILPNSGHSTPVVYADEFNKKIESFFKAPYREIHGAARFF